MSENRQEIIRKELESGTGAAIALESLQTGLRTGFRVRFSDLEKQQGPFALIKPFGLHGYQVKLGFGRFARPVIDTISNASPEDVSLARALVASIGPNVALDLDSQGREDWLVRSGAFTITATKRNLPKNADEAVTGFCRDVVVPLMASMAELIGYEKIEEPDGPTPAMEGTVLLSTVRKRERNPRNRLLCIRLHGNRCGCCGFEPGPFYGPAGGIIEVHHLEPLHLLDGPRPYDPATDLMPLCPNCHRAVHTRRPIPLSIEELREMMQLDKTPEHCR